MAWHENDDSAQNLMFEQVEEDFEDHLHRTSEEWSMFAQMGAILDVSKKDAGGGRIKRIPQDGKYVRKDIKISGHDYAAGRRGTSPWLPGSDPSGSYADQIPTPEVITGRWKFGDVYLQADFKGTAKAARKSKKGGYADLVDFRVTDATEGFKNRLAKKLAGTKFGILGVIKAADADADTTYDRITVNYAGYAGADDIATLFAGAHWLSKGLVVDAVAPGSPALLAGALRTGAGGRGRRITGVAKDTGTSGAGVSITLDASHQNAWSDGDYLVLFNERQETAIDTAAEYEDGLSGFNGILDAVDDGTLVKYHGNIERASYPTMCSSVFGNSGTLRNLTPDLLNYAYDQNRQIGGGKIGFGYGRFSVMRKFLSFLTITGANDTSIDNPRRYNEPDVTIGIPKFRIYPLGEDGELKWMSSRNALTHAAFFIDPSTMRILIDGPPRMIDEDGLKFLRVQGKHEFVGGWWLHAGGLMCVQGDKNFRIDDLNGDHVTA